MNEAFKLYDIGDEGDKLVVTLTDEGVVFDFYEVDAEDPDTDGPVATEAMTADEWVDWMLARRGLSR